ncbi:hypothetical protein BCR32DRAFT_287989 [Anaeromyces robustus]|uniref:Uncharacterized protein n=1 Tax=Anaeromyces robustus TaxID=1754192 RepID=A0A1Y1VPE9_9FUNG|nr:hypothetical protein BCR32DRAFT_287989 [Anaeromyces robustus]|eukprot:ORX61836.1 hypothetical protein BCR32DRAFT_287989 [Anaeromyces robustus]
MKNINIWLCYTKKYHKKFFPITLDLTLKSCAKPYLLKKTRSKNINIWLRYAKKYHKKFFPITLDLSVKAKILTFSYAMLKNITKNFPNHYLIYLSKNINIQLCYAKKYNENFSQSHLIYLSKNINIQLCYAKKYNENFSQSNLIYLLKVAQNPVQKHIKK